MDNWPTSEMIAEYNAEQRILRNQERNYYQPNQADERDYLSVLIKKDIESLMNVGFTEEQAHVILGVIDNSIIRMQIKESRNDQFFRRR